MNTRYTFARPPQTLRKARLDNIAIVPASLLPFKETWQEVANNMPKGGVLLCHFAIGKQQAILKSVETLFKQKGHMVQIMAAEGYAKG